jgi:hypothetical protein
VAVAAADAKVTAGAVGGGAGAMGLGTGLGGVTAGGAGACGLGVAGIVTAAGFGSFLAGAGGAAGVGCVAAGGGDEAPAFDAASLASTSNKVPLIGIVSPTLAKTLITRPPTEAGTVTVALSVSISRMSCP